jgi:hypothetical protein
VVRGHCARRRGDRSGSVRGGGSLQMEQHQHTVRRTSLEGSDERALHGIQRVGDGDGCTQQAMVRAGLHIGRVDVAFLFDHPPARPNVPHSHDVRGFLRMGSNRRGRLEGGTLGTRLEPTAASHARGVEYTVPTVEAGSTLPDT